MARSTNSSNASVRRLTPEQMRSMGSMTRDEGDLSPQEFVNYFKKYYSNEDKNYHSENVVLTAKFFGTPEQLAQAKSIKKRHDEFGRLTPELAKERDELQKKLAVQESEAIAILFKNKSYGDEFRALFAKAKIPEKRNRQDRA